MAPCEHPILLPSATNLQPAEIKDSASSSESCGDLEVRFFLFWAVKEFGDVPQERKLAFSQKESSTSGWGKDQAGKITYLILCRAW